MSHSEMINLQELASTIQDYRLEKRKKVQAALSLVLLCHRHRYVEESCLSLLPLEVIHMIIRMILPDMPPAGLNLWI